MPAPCLKGAEAASIAGWLTLLLVTGVGIRVLLWSVYEPIHHSDTSSYFSVARAISTGDFSDYQGRRTPGYPILLILAGLDPATVWLYQMAAGLLVSALLFYLTLQLTNRAWWAALVGMTYNLNLAQLFYEANLISETMTTLAVTVTVSLLFLVSGQLYRGARVLRGLGALGLAAGWAVLTRPQFAFVPVLVGGLVGLSTFSMGRCAKRGIRRACVAGLPGVLLMLGWSSFNYSQVGYFALSTFQGFNLTNHSVAWIETAPERYATVRDVLLKYREEKVARTGRHSMAVFEALPELQEATGLSMPALSKELQEMSIAIFLRNPLRYGLAVMGAWTDFWLAPNYWRLERLRPPSLARPLERAWNVEKWVLRFLNAAFLALVGVLILSGSVHLQSKKGLQMVSVVAVVLFSSWIQALTEYGENPRYGITVQPLVVLFVLNMVHAYWKGEGKPAKQAESPSSK